LLPDGHTLLFAERTTTAPWNDAHIVAHDLRTDRQHTILDGGFGPQYLPTGHLLFARSGSLLAVPFDPTKASAKGTPLPVLQGVVTDIGLAFGGGVGQYGIATNGTIVYVPRVVSNPMSELVWGDRNGRTTTAMSMARRFEHPRLAPDGRQVAVETRENSGVWIGDLTRDALRRLTFDSRESESPIWRPDGSQVAFAATRDAGRLTMVKAADGRGDEIPIFNHGRDTHQHLGSWSPDGRVIALTKTGGGSEDTDIFTLTLGDNQAIVHAHRQGFDGVAQLRTTRIGRWALFITFTKSRCPSAVTSYRVFSGLTIKPFVSNSFRGTAVANVVGVVVVTSTDHASVCVR
jgi:hypothetical protein